MINPNNDMMGRLIYQSLGEYDTRSQRLHDLEKNLIGAQGNKKLIERAIYKFNNTGDHQPLTYSEKGYVESVTGIKIK